jgi:glyoxylase-like metal-dependent hydrolase (beta-lactamase superfamily II)
MWDEVADGVFRRRYASLDLNVGLVVGEAGLLVIDTRASHNQGRELRNDILELTDKPVKWVINTHWHWDHVFGNSRFPEAEIWGHALCRSVLVEKGEEQRLAALRWFGEEHRDEIEEVEIVPPDRMVDPAHDLDIGNRVVRLEWLGLGHTDADLVVVVPDTAVLFAGDLLENGAPPYFGDGYPLAWQDTAANVRDRAAGVTVPGHGDVMDGAAVATQAEEIAAVAAACAEGLATGIFDGTQGPYPPETMADAWRRARVEAGFNR